MIGGINSYYSANSYKDYSYTKMGFTSCVRQLDKNVPVQPIDKVNLDSLSQSDTFLESDILSSSDIFKKSNNFKDNETKATYSDNNPYEQNRKTLEASFLIGQNINYAA